GVIRATAVDGLAAESRIANTGARSTGLAAVVGGLAAARLTKGAGGNERHQAGDDQSRRRQATAVGHVGTSQRMDRRLFLGHGTLAGLHRRPVLARGQLTNSTVIYRILNAKVVDDK